MSGLEQFIWYVVPGSLALLPAMVASLLHPASSPTALVLVEIAMIPVIGFAVHQISRLAEGCLRARAGVIDAILDQLQPQTASRRERLHLLRNYEIGLRARTEMAAFLDWSTRVWSFYFALGASVVGALLGCVLTGVICLKGPASFSSATHILLGLEVALAVVFLLRMHQAKTRVDATQQEHLRQHWNDFLPFFMQGDGESVDSP